MNLYDLIFKAGGYIDNDFKKEAYLNRAEIIRTSSIDGDKEIIPFNLGKVIEKEGLANLMLISNDLVKIYSLDEIEGATQYVSISGHVKNPGRYELFEKNMMLSDLIFKAGGFEDPLFRSKTFLQRGDLVRFNNDRIGKSILKFNLNSVLNDSTYGKNYKLLPGDEIRIYSENIFNDAKVVTIKGTVRNPGNYKLKTQMTLKDLILEAGGMDLNVYRYKVEVARIDPFNTDLKSYAQVIVFDINERFSISDVDSKNKVDEFILNPYDLITIRPDPYFSNQKQVTIEGAVLYPGDYTILKADETLSDMIKRAGGLRINAFPQGSQFSRNGTRINISLVDLIRKPKSSADFIVQDGDKLTIISKPNLIMIKGEVNRSGAHKFTPKEVEILFKTSWRIYARCRLKQYLD